MSRIMLFRLSMYEISAVTLLIGLSTPLSPQLTRRIIQVVIHSQYNAVNYVSCLNETIFGHLFRVNCVARQANDIAIITMDMPVILSSSVSPVCLPAASDDPDQFADQIAVVIGYGPASIKKRWPIIIY